MLTKTWIDRIKLWPSRIHDSMNYLNNKKYIQMIEILPPIDGNSTRHTVIFYAKIKLPTIMFYNGIVVEDSIQRENMMTNLTIIKN